MTTSSRSIAGAILGLLVFLSGFWLQFHATSFMTTTTPDGVPWAPSAHVFQQLADCLQYSGAAIGVFAVGVWMLSGPRRLDPVAASR